MILDSRGRPISSAPEPRRRDSIPMQRVSAKYDAAQTNTENAKHWSFADALSADSAANPHVRATLRNRSRYEVANNSYAKGITSFISNDTIGRSIRLVLQTDASKKSKKSKYDRRRLMTTDEAKFVEGEFFEWMDAVRANQKIRTMRTARAVDGEGFADLLTNPRLETPVKLDFRPFECEMCQDEYFLTTYNDRNRVDGIRYDNAGNPNDYYILDDHPGSGFGGILGGGKWVPARNILHLFNADRPGQRRGIPQLTPALPLFAQLRRFTLSVIAAAETAADFAAIMFTQSPADGEAAKASPFETVEIERRMMMAMPDGWDMRQFKAEQPVSTYSDFVRTIMREINRCLEVPMNVALGDSSGYNYASGKLDWQIWEKARRVDRSSISQQLLDRLFAEWFFEARLINGYMPETLRRGVIDISHDFLFDGDKHQDPLKEASAQEKRLRNLTSTLADEWAREGCDWEEKLEQIARERERAKALDIKINDAVSVSEEEEEDEEEVIVSRDSSGRLLGFKG